MNRKRGYVQNPRLNALRDLLVEKKLSNILLTDSIDVRYLCGFCSSSVSVLISRKKNYLLTDFRYQEAACKFCNRNPVWTFVPVKESLQESIKKLISPGATVGFQGNELTVDRFSELKKTLKGVVFKSVSQEIARIFEVKLRTEIEVMRQAAEIGDTALKWFLERLEPGMTEIEAASMLELFCSEGGSQRTSFETIVLFGARSALPHGRPSAKKLARGDYVLVDFGCVVDGYCSDMTRTVVMGKAGTRQREIYAVVKSAQARAVEAARAGMRSVELDKIARDIIAEAGYREEFGHALGHGVGLRVHERPRVSPHVKELLQENTVVTIEPGIYIPGFGGVRIEDMVVLHKDGNDVLTTFSHELIEL
ncbi:MAG TPA: Xaa-Pro peptidase family protein [Chitinispirillaceae bacterium]|nr:Xaa-Pro peptidase family protein [Chitinispirillaceae bacterium]